MFKKIKKHHIITILTLLIIFAAVALFARAGGAGGSSGGGGGGGGDGIGALIYIVIRLLIELPFPVNIIAVAAIIGIFFFMSWRARKKVKEQTIFNQLPSGEGVKKVKGYDTFLKNNPDFDEEEFIDNVRDAFYMIQEAWENQNISEVRKFISDGVYQRFNTQFKMMQLLKQKNTLEDTDVKNIYIDKVESDGLFDIVHVAIHASIKDKFVSEIDSSLNSGGYEEFVEYWSFIKKRGVPRKDIYQTDDCPNCGAPLPEDMGEMSKCEMCGTQTNSGEYDWVLSEITQADDYVSTHPKLSKSDNLNNKIRSLIKENDDFSVQLAEDKGSNGYLQIITAIALNDPSIMRRFVSDEVFDKVSSRMMDGKTAYNRIYLNDVYLIGVSESDNKNHLHIAIKSSFQRVNLQDGSVTKIDPVVVSKTEVVVMSRDKDAPLSKGSIYAHACPSCGAPVEDSLNLDCQYCGTTLNSTSQEWIITDLMDVDDYEDYKSGHSSEFSYNVDVSLIDKLYDSRDFAFNNVMVMIGADGVLNEEEMLFAHELAKKWGYNVEKIGQLFTMAQSGSLVLRMPDDEKQRKKIYKLMEKAAAIDETVTEEEQALLDNIKDQYNIQ